MVRNGRDFKSNEPVCRFGRVWFKKYFTKGIIFLNGATLIISDICKGPW